MKRRERIDEAIQIACLYASFDGEHHKTWVIDQMLRALMTEKDYSEFTKESDIDGTWDVGVAP